MRKMRLRGLRRSPATAISLVALVIAMSGSAYAATGGTFILGKANKETSTATLANSKGTPLALTAPSGKAPLKVSNGVQVPNLNASELDGQPATAFLPATGTAANSSELGGQPASSFLTGDHNGGTVTVGNTAKLALADVGTVDFSCGSNGILPVGVISLTSGLNSVLVWWLNRDGGGYTTLNVGQSATLASTAINPYTVVLQVAWSDANGSHVATADLSMTSNDAAENCTFAGQSGSSP